MDSTCLAHLAGARAASCGGILGTSEKGTVLSSLRAWVCLGVISGLAGMLSLFRLWDRRPQGLLYRLVAESDSAGLGRVGPWWGSCKLW